MLTFKDYSLQDGRDRLINAKTAAHFILGVSISRLSQLKDVLPPHSTVAANRVRGEDANLYSLRMVIEYAMAHPVNLIRRDAAKGRRGVRIQVTCRNRNCKQGDKGKPKKWSVKPSLVPTVRYCSNDCKHAVARKKSTAKRKVKEECQTI